MLLHYGGSVEHSMLGELSLDIQCLDQRRIKEGRSGGRSWGIGPNVFVDHAL